MRILAIEEGGFAEGAPGERKGKALLVGLVTEDSVPDKVLVSEVTVDGLDATEQLIRMVRRKDGKLRPDLILLGSISYAGFNPMDPRALYRRLRIPVLVANPRKPDIFAVESALQHHFEDWKQRLAIFKAVGKPRILRLGRGRRLYFHAVGLSGARAENLIRKLVVFGNRPEPLRIARILAHELSKVK